MPVLGNVHPIKIKNIIFHDIISLFSWVFIFLIDRATQEVGSHEKYLKDIVGRVFEIYTIVLVGSISTNEAWHDVIYVRYIFIRSTLT